MLCRAGEAGFAIDIRESTRRVAIKFAEAAAYRHRHP